MYEHDISIDESALDVEWLNQPTLMLKYGRVAAQTGKEMDVAKDQLEIVRAQLDKAIRLNPEEFYIGKLTEPLIDHTIKTQPEYQDASTKYIEAKYEAELAKFAVRAFDQRKSALEALVRLHGQQYFAGPSVPRDLSKEWERKAKRERVDNGIATKMARRRAK